jgi:DNA-directed RNA polymerase specialized sigma24 family protein
MLSQTDLLALFDSDPYRAEEKYRELYKQLVHFFERKCYRDPEDLAQETLRRGFSKLQQGYEIKSTNPTLYFFDIARHVTQDSFRAYRENSLEDLEPPSTLRLFHNLNQSEQWVLLRECFGDLNDDDFEALIAFGRDLRTARAVAGDRYVAKARRRLKAQLLSPRERAQAEFTVYYPHHIQPRKWSTMLAYMHLRGALTIVDSDSKRRLKAGDTSIRRKSAKERVSIARGAKIVIVPHSEALEFNPRQVSFIWSGDFHGVEFRCRTRRNTGVDKRISVHVKFFVASVLVREIVFDITLHQQMETFISGKHTSTTAHPYQRVFVSYCHQDREIAKQLEKAYTAIGIEYLRDVKKLRSGEKWAPALLRLIEESEIFQLLWSKAAKRSANVEQEWRYALHLDRTEFIRPIYWEQPLPPPPDELADIHFAYLQLRNKRHL